MKFPKSVNVLLLGSGGRENAFAWKIAQSERLAKLFIAPGNAGTKSCGTNVEMNPTDFAILKQFVISNNINLVVVGPEDPLVKGIYDYFMDDNDIMNIPVIGPSALGAKLEGSKDFAKNFMIKHGIPTAQYKTFTKDNIEEGYTFIDSLSAPYVLKADGLAAGKGVVILDSAQEAKQELSDMLSGKFGAASSKVVIEEYLSGIEVSVFVATDGKSYKILPEAKDYKRIGEGDTGLNTGGMGAVSPVPFCDEEFMEKVRKSIVEPTIEGLKTDEITYKGFIFIGLMNCDGEPKVIEYNVRMGDPETEVVIPRIKSDIIDLFEGIAFGSLKSRELEISEETAATVVCVSEGYPGDYRKGFAIEGLDQETDSIIFHAGTTTEGKNVITSGGRVLAVTSFGKSVGEAVNKSFKTIDNIDYKGKYYRKDIGKDLI
ncbi:MAG: phosphoribosylamine--glycine ligase [Rikenellaceae bacterium]|nr:phosphoribosylamine--glycine ligase [Rikenellaceae bacterium]